MPNQLPDNLFVVPFAPYGNGLYVASGGKRRSVSPTMPQRS